MVAAVQAGLRRAPGCGAAASARAAAAERSADVALTGDPPRLPEPYGPAQLPGQPGRFPLKNVLNVARPAGGASFTDSDTPRVGATRYPPN
jgi:hypothetical protein